MRAGVPDPRGRLPPPRHPRARPGAQSGRHRRRRPLPRRPPPERLEAAATWAERIALVEGELLAALADSAEPDPLVDWMWDRIRRSGGRARIGDLVARTGWSHRHVTSRFARRFGVSPKAAAGVVRFERAAAEVGRVPLPDLAVRHGYADQSHLTREMLRYAGEPPGRLAAGGHPTAYTALGTKPR
ncbi:AraC family transcriptional regulator [Microbacterium lushaniae]|uniref:AraC family transcriptional regulator n=1 Tax=Microbacterium lushaniae TaxID=2614639 RepID=A0A5J6L5U7_9MICO|nr:AraC family transcriptional regulator [Microbacterium lushaniae]